MRHIEELEAEANAIYSNHRGAVGDNLFGLRPQRRLYLRRRRAADLPDLPDNAAHRHPEDGFLRREKRGIAKIGFESFLINLYVACFALIALTG